MKWINVYLQNIFWCWWYVFHDKRRIYFSSETTTIRVFCSDYCTGRNTSRLAPIFATRKTQSILYTVTSLAQSNRKLLTCNTSLHSCWELTLNRRLHVHLNFPCTCLHICLSIPVSSLSLTHSVCLSHTHPPSHKRGNESAKWSGAFIQDRLLKCLLLTSSRITSRYTFITVIVYQCRHCHYLY